MSIRKLFAGIRVTEDLGTFRKAATIATVTGLVAFYFSMFFLTSNRAVNNIFLLTVCLPTLAALRWRDFRSLHTNIEINGFILLILYLLASHWWSLEANQAQIRLLAERATYLYILIVAIYIFFSRTKLTSGVTYWLVGGTALCVAESLFRFYSSHDLVERFEAYGRFANSNHIAILCAGMCAIALTRCASKNRVKQVFFCAASLVFLICITLSHSRSGLMALLAACGFIAIRLGRGKAAIVALFVILASSILPGLTIWTERGLSFRDGIWAINWSRLQHCGIVFGCGINTSSEAMINGFTIRHTHSIPFGMFFYGGLIALTLYIALIASALYRGSTQLKLSDACLLLLAGCVGTLVENHQIITSAGPLWVYLIAPLVFLALHRNMSDSTASAPRR